MGRPPPADALRRLRVLYVSPLKALVHDVDRNLKSPLTGVSLAGQARGERLHEVRVSMRTGDTPADERRAFGKHPPDILVTTPESLYLLLTSSAREALRGVEWVIVDEIHAMAGTKRGAHLALSMERLERLVEAAEDLGPELARRAVDPAALVHRRSLAQVGRKLLDLDRVPRHHAEGLHVHDEAFRGALVPVPDHLLVRQPVVSRVRLDGVEAVGVVAQSLLGALHPRRVEVARQRLVRPGAGADADRRGQGV
jgi:hypothetical protein